jgi:hypothetical protein
MVRSQAIECPVRNRCSIVIDRVVAEYNVFIFNYLYAWIATLQEVPFAL